MTCTKLEIPGGGVAIVCTRGRGARKKRCVTCNVLTDLLCDGCDSAVCPGCSVAPISSQDFCPHCALPAWREWLHLPNIFISPVRAARRMEFRAWVRSNAARFAELVTMTRAGRAAAEAST